GVQEPADLAAGAGFQTDNATELDVLAGLLRSIRDGSLNVRVIADCIASGGGLAGSQVQELLHDIALGSEVGIAQHLDDRASAVVRREGDGNAAFGGLALAELGLLDQASLAKRVDGLLN